MGVIKKIYDDTIEGQATKSEVYPITSTQAVYDANNETLDSILEDINEEIASIQETATDEEIQALFA